MKVHVLSDYKITSVYSREAKLAWIQQLNLLRLLCVRNGLQVDRLQVVALYRDWRPKEALKEDYPQSQVAVLPVPMWTIEEANDFLEERVRLHRMDPAPPCTDEERWKQPEVWAVMKKGQKRAVKLFENRPEFDPFSAQAGLYWQHRPGAYRRCESYCPVSAICPQWAKDKANADGTVDRETLE